MDFDGEPEHWNFESHDRFADRCKQIPQHLFILGYGLGAGAGNDAAGLFANVGGVAVDRPRLEEASAIAGGGTWPTFRRITLPLVLPAAAAAALLLFIQTVESFEVPLLLGGRARVLVYTTEVYFNTSRMPTDWGLSSTYSMMLLLLAMVLLFVYFRLVRHGECYQTITGRDYRPRRVDLGRWKYPACALSLLLIFLITGLPFFTMLYASFLPRFQAPTAEAFQSMTWLNYANLLADGGYALKPLWNSTLLGVGSATAVMLLVAGISYFVHKTRIRGRKILDFLGFAPIALPSVVLGSAFMWLYLIIPLPVIGTQTSGLLRELDEREKPISFDAHEASHIIRWAFHVVAFLLAARISCP